MRRVSSSVLRRFDRHPSHSLKSSHSHSFLDQKSDPSGSVDAGFDGVCRDRGTIRTDLNRNLSRSSLRDELAGQAEARPAKQLLKVNLQSDWNNLPMRSFERGLISFQFYCAVIIAFRNYENDSTSHFGGTRKLR
jgi:hypothetical protein